MRQQQDECTEHLWVGRSLITGVLCHFSSQGKGRWREGQRESDRPGIEDIGKEMEREGVKRESENE